MIIHKLQISPLTQMASCLCGHWSFSCRQATAELLQDLQLRHKSADAIEAKVLQESRAVRKAFKFHLLQVRETVRERQGTA